MLEFALILLIGIVFAILLGKLSVWLLYQFQFKKQRKEYDDKEKLRAKQSEWLRKQWIKVVHTIDISEADESGNGILILHSIGEELFNKHCIIDKKVVGRVHLFFNFRIKNE